MIERAGPLLLIAGLVAAVVAAIIPSPVVVAVCLAVAGVVSVVPFGRLSATDLVFSLTGPLSGASLVLMAIGIADVLFPEASVLAATGAIPLAVFVLIAAAPLYLSVVGGLGPDLYRTGFGGWIVPVFLAVALAIGFWFGSFAIAAWVAVSGLLYLTRAYASRNLIDYSVDPVAVIFALVFLVEAALW